MFVKGCKYCGTSDCWGHTNDEKSAMDQALRAQESASNNWKRIEKLETLVMECKKTAIKYDSGEREYEMTDWDYINKQLDKMLEIIR